MKQVKTSWAYSISQRKRDCRVQEKRSEKEKKGEKERIKDRKREGEREREIYRQRNGDIPN